MGVLLGVVEAARLVGVSPSTLKRMSDDNLLPCVRTPGGHRRFDHQQLEAAASSHLGGLVRGRRTEVTAGAIESLTEMLLAGDDQAVGSVFGSSVSYPKELVARIDNELAPAMWKIGELWHDKKIDVFNEHIATATTQRLLDKLNIQLEPVESTCPIAITASIRGSFDEVAPRMVSVAFRALPARVLNLGCNVPVESIIAAAAQVNASWLCLSHTHLSRVEDIVSWYERLSRGLPQSTRVLIGGGAMSPAIRRLLKFDAHYESLTAALLAERCTVDASAAIGPSSSER